MPPFPSDSGRSNYKDGAALRSSSVAERGYRADVMNLVDDVSINDAKGGVLFEGGARAKTISAAAVPGLARSTFRRCS
jgi:hypothetical protein